MEIDDKKYKRLLMQIDEALNGHHIDQVIPALAFVLAVAAFRSGTEKRIALSFVAETMDTIYSRGEKGGDV
jgi:hypothetical protein